MNTSTSIILSGQSVNYSEKVFITMSPGWLSPRLQLDEGGEELPANRFGLWHRQNDCEAGQVRKAFLPSW
jgi:hypothetical protein